MFSPLATREPLSKAVAAKIEEAIRKRKLVMGERLPSEHEMCQQFGVSRTAVREALRILSARGLISIEKGRGNYVKDLSSDSVTDPLHLYLQFKSKRDYVLEVVHARQIIEPSIASIAAVNHTQEDVEKLEADLEELRTCNGDYVELAALDMEFHVDIAKASQNTLMPLILDPIHKLLPNIKSSVYKNVEEARASAVEYHRKILDAILRHDAPGAHEAMRVHLQIAEEHAVRMLNARTPSAALAETLIP